MKPQAKIREAGGRKRLAPGCESVITPLPNFARACGCVPVGGHPDKRPDSRPKTRPIRFAGQGRGVARRGVFDNLTGSRRRTGEPCPPQGTRLEATTIGLFWSQLVSRASYRRGLFFLPAVRCGVSPSQSKALLSGRGSLIRAPDMMSRRTSSGGARHRSSVSKADPESAKPPMGSIPFAGRQAARGGGFNDRPYPRVPSQPP